MFFFLLQFQDIGLLILRLALGFIMIFHGYPKMFKDFKNHVDLVKSLNFPFPKFFAFLSAVSEFFGGLSIILGFLTQIAAFLVFVNMVVALLVKVIKWKKGFGDYEFDLILASSAFFLIFAGPGSFSVDEYLFR